MKWFFSIAGLVLMPLSLLMFSWGENLMGWNALLHSIFFLLYALYMNSREC